MIDLDFLRGLIEAVDHSGVDSLEISRADTQIRISKTPPPQPAPAPTAPTAGAAATLPSAAVAEAPTAEPEQPAEEEAPGPELTDVTSPMVGTFYRAPSPDAPPYVEVGSQVGKGQTLCILEAMKLMNELESEFEGTVREILVENEEPVEYGQVLFRIEPVGGGD